jgi:hypothetical protein
MAEPAPQQTDPERGERPVRGSQSLAGGATRSWRRRTALVAVGVALVLAAGCASGTDDVVATGPDGTTAPTTTAPSSTTTPASTTSSSAVPPSSTTSTAPSSSTTTSTTAPTTATSVAPAVSVPSTTPGLGALTTQVFWVRAPGDARVVDLPGYRDPASGPLPLVVYGSLRGWPPERFRATLQGYFLPASLLGLAGPALWTWYAAYSLFSLAIVPAAAFVWFSAVV